VDEIKTLSFRMPRPTWLYYKKLAADRDMNLTELMLNVLTKYKNNHERVLTNRDTKV
jgi:hypothetical protein